MKEKTESRTVGPGDEPSEGGASAQIKDSRWFRFLTRDVIVSEEVRGEISHSSDFHNQIAQMQDKADWLKIYCSLIASGIRCTREEFIIGTDEYFDAFKKRWEAKSEAGPLNLGDEGVELEHEAPKVPRETNEI